MDRFKATEFRTLVMYSGVIIFKEILKEDLFNHFLILMVVVRTLCDGSRIRDEETLDYIQELCKIFVKQYKKLYSAKLSVVYNVHLLLHVVEDVKNFGILDSFSAFPYEDMLGQIKKKLGRVAFLLLSYVDALVKDFLIKARLLLQPVKKMK